MSEHRPADRVHQTLTALRTDLDRTHLADAAAVRRRGQARSRHQAVGLVAAAAAVVAVVVGGSLGLTGSDQATTELPASPSPSASERVRSLAADPFVRTPDVGTVGPYAGFQRSPDPVPAGQRPLQCMPDPTNLGAGQTRSALFFSDLDARFTEHVLRFADARGATRAEQRLAAAFRGCPPGDPADAATEDTGPTTTVGGAPAFAAHLHASRLTTPVADSEPFYYELGVARVDNVVVVLQWSSNGNPNDPPDTVQWSDDLLDIAATRALG